MPSLHFIDSGSLPAPFNMARDEYLFRHAAGTWLCVYGWEPPAISLGYGQKAETELDSAAIKKAGLDVVRRLTGGRAVLHDCEITYSLCADTGGVFGNDLNATYQAIALALQRTLDLLGVCAELEKGSPRDTREKSGASLPCFASTARHELKVDGKKIIGSAQRRDKGRFLQHGSLILEHRFDITDFLKLDAERKRAYRAIVEKESVTLSRVSEKRFAWETLAEAFGQGFSESLGLELAPAELDAAAKEKISALSARYSG